MLLSKISFVGHILNDVNGYFRNRREADLTWFKSLYRYKSNKHCPTKSEVHLADICGRGLATFNLRKLVVYYININQAKHDVSNNTMS